MLLICFMYKIWTLVLPTVKLIVRSQIVFEVRVTDLVKATKKNLWLIRRDSKFKTEKRFPTLLPAVSITCIYLKFRLIFYLLLHYIYDAYYSRQ
jgi:hypothetical protein